MDSFTTVTGRMVPLLRANIDTDQIIPTEFLKRVERTGFGQFLFYDWAHDAEGEPDPAFILNQTAYQGASVLVSGPNFGSGSSREHAPWALQDRGFRVIIAPSFADIFRANCHKIGLLPVVLSDQVVTQLASLATGDPSAEVTVDLGAQTVEAGEITEGFEIDPSARSALLEGWDEIDMTLRNESSIASYEAHRREHRPSFSGARIEERKSEPHG